MPTMREHSGSGKRRVLAQHALGKLKEHQHTIRALLDEANDALSTSGIPLGHPLASLRWQLIRALRQYQLFKHTEIFDPLSRHDEPARSGLARDMKQRCIDMGDRFTACVQRWSTNAIATSWSTYRDEAGAMLGTIREHIDREELETRQLLSGIQRTRRP